MRYHRFILGELVAEGFDPRWARREARCSRCGQVRLVWHAVDASHGSVLNIGPCYGYRSPIDRIRDWLNPAR